MHRVIVPALLAIALVATSTTTASAGLFNKLCGNNCDSCCDIEPACGCEAPCAAPTCGCEVVDPCCDSGCRKPGLLKRLFSRHGNSCDSGCCDIEPACGCEAPACGGCAAPTCGCEVVDPCCDSGCGSHKRGFLKRLFSRHGNNCNSGCCDVVPACGFEAPCAAPCEPTCGCEAIEPSCGCGF